LHERRSQTGRSNVASGTEPQKQRANGKQGRSGQPPPRGRIDGRLALHVKHRLQTTGVRRDETTVTVRMTGQLELDDSTLLMGQHDVAKVGRQHFRLGFEFHALINIRVIGIVVAL